MADRLDALALRDDIEVVHNVGHGDVLHALAAVLVGALRVGGDMTEEVSFAAVVRKDASLKPPVDKAVNIAERNHRQCPLTCSI